jgi:hypothetical protein
VRNSGDEEYSFEEALHSYFAVKDISRVTVEGLDRTSATMSGPAWPASMRRTLQYEVTLGASDAHSMSTRYAAGHPAWDTGIRRECGPK